MTIRSAFVATIAVVLAASAASAQGTRVTTAVGTPFASSSLTIDLSSQATGDYNLTTGPVLLPGGITFTALQPSVLGQGTYGLGSNGLWGVDPNVVYAGTNDVTGWMRFGFSSGVFGVGAIVNYDPGVGSNFFLRLLGQSGNLLDEFDISGSAPIAGDYSDIDVGEFRGIFRSQADVYAVEFDGAYGVARDLRVVVPEPSTLMLVGAGLLLAVGLRRRSANHA